MLLAVLAAVASLAGTGQDRLVTYAPYVLFVGLEDGVCRYEIPQVQDRILDAAAAEAWLAQVPDKPMVQVEITWRNDIDYSCIEPTRALVERAGFIHIVEQRWGQPHPGNTFPPR